ncbi:piggyBac transposable element-derived protein 3-like [Ostrinia nubilalis]|uniref:piggyBac transposable element-derived protein 3-like n=1 Tax=Ostrinia nubilalis TaxID=29057 RepID=UPI0030823ED8
MYWDRKFKFPLICAAMTRDRFVLLRNRIKFVVDADVSVEERSADKLWKVRPLINAIKQGCRALPKQQCLCVDEIIVPFTEQCSIKQYCPGKPNPVGLKMFVLADPQGLICDFDVYQGQYTYPNYDNTHFSLREKAVLNLTEDLIPGHKLYFDRYFTSVKLIKELTKRHLMATGTIQKKRIPASAKPLIQNNRELHHEGQGACEVLTDSSDNIAITQWFDNKPVLLMSNIHAKEPTDTCKRWSKSLGIYTHVSRPDVIKAYNTNMGGVESAVKLLAVAPNRYKSRKWTDRFFGHMIDLAVTNSWVSYKADQTARGTPSKHIKKLRSFKLELANVLIDTYFETSTAPNLSSPSTPQKKRRGRIPVIPTPSLRCRRYNARHIAIFADRQNKCRVCHKKTWMSCTSCQINLCIVRDRNCFRDFHS